MGMSERQLRMGREEARRARVTHDIYRSGDCGGEGGWVSRRKQETNERKRSSPRGYKHSSSVTPAIAPAANW